MATDDAANLLERLGEADGAALAAIVRDHLDRLDSTLLRQLLRHPHLNREVIEMLLDEQPILGLYEVRKELAGNPKTPEARAMRLVSTLYWRDLVRLGGDSRSRPTIRRTADRVLAQRLPGLAVGEKVAIARRCGPGLVAALSRDPNPRVIQALLENPRMTEAPLIQMAMREGTRPEVLAMLARDRRWGHRYRIRVPLCRNPSTPAATALGLLPSLKKIDLKEVARSPRLAKAVRQRAELLLGRGR